MHAALVRLANLEIQNLDELFALGNWLQSVRAKHFPGNVLSTHAECRVFLPRERAMSRLPNSMATGRARRLAALCAPGEDRFLVLAALQPAQKSDLEGQQGVDLTSSRAVRCLRFTPVRKADLQGQQRAI